MTYDPESRSSRESLAIDLLVKLRECGFSLEREMNGTDEAVYAREVHGTNGTLRVLVYTTVVDGGGVPVVRECGKDAIRVCAVYKSPRTGLDRGLNSETRTNRTGTVAAIVKRMHGRMRSVYGAAMNLPCCAKCGAPTFKSKKGNLVCADLCWKSADELVAEARRGSSGFAARREAASYWAGRSRRSYGRGY